MLSKLVINNAQCLHKSIVLTITRRGFLEKLTVDFDRLGLRAGERILDMGCGGGRHAFAAMKRDAAVIALTSQAALQRLSSVKHNPQRPRLDPPWEHFREDLAGTNRQTETAFHGFRRATENQLRGFGNRQR